MAIQVETWLSLNDGRRMHPRQVWDYLAQTNRRDPTAAYIWLEGKGCLVPVSYRDGNIDSVIVRSLAPERLVDIAFHNNTPLDFLVGRFVSLQKNPHSGENLDLPQPAIDSLIKGGYIERSGEYYVLGKKGETYLEPKREEDCI